MAEYIERDALLKKMLGLHTIPVYIGHVTDEDKMFETMVEVVEEQPTADVVEVVHAEWIKAGFGISERVVCSHCRSHHGSYLKPPFCSQCGAKMGGERRCEDE